MTSFADGVRGLAGAGVVLVTKEKGDYLGRMWSENKYTGNRMRKIDEFLLELGKDI